MGSGGKGNSQKKEQSRPGEISLFQAGAPEKMVRGKVGTLGEKK